MLKKCISVFIIMLFMYITASEAQQKKDSVSEIMKISRITQTAILNGDNVFLRDKPSIKGSVIKKLVINTEMTTNEYIETTDKKYTFWYHVSVPESKLKGYVYAKYLTEVTYAGDNSPVENFVAGFNSTGLYIASKKNTKTIGTAQIKEKVDQINLISYGNYLFFSAYDLENTGIDAVFCGILNTKTSKWAYKAPSKSMENPRMLFLSPTKIYAVIDSGSSAGARDLTVVNLPEGKVVYETSYDSSAAINWDKKGLIFYRYEADYDRGLPEPEEGHGYSRKIIWNNGKETKLNEYIQTYLE